MRNLVVGSGIYAGSAHLQSVRLLLPCGLCLGLHGPFGLACGLGLRVTSVLQLATGFLQNRCFGRWFLRHRLAACTNCLRIFLLRISIVQRSPELGDPSITCDLLLLHTFLLKLTQLHLHSLILQTMINGYRSCHNCCILLRVSLSDI